MMKGGRRLSMVAVIGVALLAGSATTAEAGMKLRLENGGDTVQVDDATNSGSLFYSNLVNPFAQSRLTLTLLMATSNSAYDGPPVISELGVRSFTVTNLTNASQTLAITLSDVGFDPNSPSRPLVVYNSASGTFSQMTNGLVTFQTFAFDGTDYFRTGADTVATDTVTLTPISTGGTTTALFNPVNTQFSLTNVLTLTLDPNATISGFTGISMVHAPEPGTMALALTGLPLLAFGAWRRRRQRVGS